MHRPESILIYNPLAGEQKLDWPTLISQVGIPAYQFGHFLAHAPELITSELRQVVVSGGDGTSLTVLRLLTEHLPPEAVVKVLLWGTGTDNMAARTCNTRLTGGSSTQILDAFMADELAVKEVRSYPYRTPDGEKGSLFWSLAAGEIGTGMLENLEQFRGVKDKGWRKLFAFCNLLARESTTQIVHATTENANGLSGKDVAFVSGQFPRWPTFLNIQEAAGVTKPSGDELDYLLRLGHSEQNRRETIAGVALDLIGLRLWRRTITDTLYAVPVSDTTVQLTAKGRKLVIDSEVFTQNTSGVATVSRTKNTTGPQLLLARR